ncbi:MAG: hypothetical protein HGB36_09780 [Chlorobiaceae bacterium]|nr:hypothetical protein [Chlorobiaceae bacterium]
MPSARMDAHGSLHYVMIPGIEWTTMVLDDKDRPVVVTRSGKEAEKAGTVIYVVAWGFCQTARDFEGSSEPDFGTLKKAVRGISRLSSSLYLHYLRTYNTLIGCTMDAFGPDGLPGVIMLSSIVFFSYVLSEHRELSGT